MVLKWPQTTLEWPRYGSKWPKIDILMTLSLISRWFIDWTQPDIDAIESTKYVPMKYTHWFNDTMIYWIFQFLLLKRSRIVLLRTNRRNLTKIVPRWLARIIFLVYVWDSVGQKVPFLSINDHHWNPQMSTKCYLFRNLCIFELLEYYDADTWLLNITCRNLLK